MEIVTVIIYISIYIGLISTTFYALSFIAGQKKERLLYTDKELEKIKVSVVIPAYNEEESIARTLKSILKTNYPNFEIIVVDDGSKDRTLEIAKKFEGAQVRVFTKKNSGKGAALNLGIKKAKGEIVFTMDADTTVHPDSMKKMVRYFKDKTVMSSTPAMVINNPETIWQRIQYMELAMGLFLRKSFAALRAVYVAPGAFAAYRKWFFDKYGGYDEHNITEDLEMGLRIQALGFHTENCPEAPAYTDGPRTFMALTRQRRRWYFGHIKNLWNYRRLISPKYGDMGAFVIPTSLLSTLLSIIILIFLCFKVLFELRDNIIFLQNINFDIPSAFNFNLYVIERLLFLFFSKPEILFTLCFMVILGMYTIYATKKIGKSPLLILNLILFFIAFATIYGFWWIISIFQSLTKKTIKW